MLGIKAIGTSADTVDFGLRREQARKPEANDDSDAASDEPEVHHSSRRDHDRYGAGHRCKKDAR